MSNSLTPIDNSRAGIVPSQRMRDRLSKGRGISDNFSAGTTGGYHVLSIRASKFHIRLGDTETTMVDPASGYPVNYLDVVLVNASKQLAKTYYANAYQQGAADQPDCWSMDSIRPDPSVQRKINPTCGDCPMNAFGSRMTPAGKQAKACSDHRRVAITLPTELAKPDPTPILLRVPQSSLKSMRNYVDLLARNGYEPGGCVTRLSFDTTASYPLLQFRFVGPLDDQEFGTVESLLASPNVNSMVTGARTEAAAVADDDDDLSQAGKVGLTPIARQDIGFSAGMLSQPTQAVKTPPVQPQVVQAPQIIDLPDGRKFNATTGQFVEAKAPEPPKPTLDPGIIKLPDGKFLHLASNTFVSSQFTDAVEVPVHAQPTVDPTPKSVPAEQPKTRTRRSKAEMEAAKASAAPPEEAAPKANGHTPVDKPNVVTATPKLEQLLAGLVPNKD